MKSNFIGQMVGFGTSIQEAKTEYENGFREEYVGTLHNKPLIRVDDSQICETDYVYHPVMDDFLDKAKKYSDRFPVLANGESSYLIGVAMQSMKE